MGLVVTFISFTFASCTYNVKYRSEIGLDTPIPVKTNIKVLLLEKISRVISRESVVRAITNDLVQNVFPYFVEADADILCYVEVYRLDVRDESWWGCLWFPLVFFGAPTDKLKGMADISLRITYPDGVIIKSYRETSYKEDWYGLYNYPSNPIVVRTEEVLKETMEKIKKEINYDRNVIIAAIEGERKPYEVSKESKPATITNPPKLTFDYSFTDENGDKILEGGEKISLKVRVKNQGKGVARGVKILVSGNNKACNLGGEKYIGDIPPGGEKEVIFETILPNQIESGEAIILIKVTEAQGFGALEEKTLWVTMQPAK